MINRNIYAAEYAIQHIVSLLLLKLALIWHWVNQIDSNENRLKFKDLCIGETGSLQFNNRIVLGFVRDGRKLFKIYTIEVAATKKTMRVLIRCSQMKMRLRLYLKKIFN